MSDHYEATLMLRLTSNQATMLLFLVTTALETIGSKPDTARELVLIGEGLASGIEALDLLAQEAPPGPDPHLN